MKKIIKRSILTLLISAISLPVIIFVTLLCLPIEWDSECIGVPVVGATQKDYNPESFWHPWGDHRHRGVDIFAKRGAIVHPARNGIVLWTGNSKNGGKHVLILDNYLYFTYYAHLDTIATRTFAIVDRNDTIGKVGNTGNAKGKPCHLHFSECSFFNDKKHGTKFDKKYRMYFTNPHTEFNI